MLTIEEIKQEIKRCEKRVKHAEDIFDWIPNLYNLEDIIFEKSKLEAWNMILEGKKRPAMSEDDCYTRGINAIYNYVDSLNC